jgi:hypothetical protein
MQNRRDQSLASFARAGDLYNMPVGEPIEYRTSVTASPVDRGGVVHMTLASANTFTIPTDATTEALYGDGPFPNGTTFIVVQWGAGATTLVFATGVTERNSFGTLALSAQYKHAAVRKVGVNEWHVMAMG